MELVFSTRELPEKDRFPCWREEFFRNSGCEFVMETPKEPFFAEMRARTLGSNAVLYDQNASAYAALHGPREVVRSTQNHLFVAAKLSGTFQYRHDGNSTVARPGDLLLFDTTRPWHLEIPQGRHRTLLLTLDREALLPRLASPDLPAIQKLTGRRPLGGLVDGYLRSLATVEPAPSAATGQALIDHFCGLLALALGATEETRETAGQAGLKAARLRAIRDYAEQRLNDPDLTPAAVAARFGISTRYLHKLFEETGTSFSQWLQIRRLECCRRELADPAHDARGIAEIAYRWGFNDLSHFGRRFRAVYGVSPRDARPGRRNGR
jgi:AraC family transcriptional activator of tynA and feaB